jgi:hypothetical protein
VIHEAHPVNQHHHYQNNNSPADSLGTSKGYFVYPENIINGGVNACKKIIIGKITTEEPIHVSSIQNSLENF